MADPLLISNSDASIIDSCLETGVSRVDKDVSVS